jgi:hypothetical protein
MNSGAKGREWVGIGNITVQGATTEPRMTVVGGCRSGETVRRNRGWRHGRHPKEFEISAITALGPREIYTDTGAPSL